MRSAAARVEAGEERVSLTARAYAEIRRRILDNEMPAGTLMLEQELAELLQMSRTPVREALILLAKEGMVEVRPRHGMRVLPVSADDMEEIYQILTALEADAAGEIARQGLPEAQVAALKAAVAEMDAALAADDLVRWARGDAAFHRILMESCPNRRLRALVYQFWDQSHRVRMLTLRLRPKPVSSNQDHLALVEAIERRDADTARAIHREHRIRNGRMLVRLLREHGLTQL
ncbi:MAG TPA: GntR family transcriptional regulator [Beijerinckiaceae bacterium]|nr:GntR family transcriptional regulator [Beijerinckiaceae bacterium]